MSVDYADRFWSHVDRSGDCWLWTGGKTQYGYGQFGIVTPRKPPLRTAHRVAYELAVGPIPEGLVVDHLCRNRLCCNPAHLEAVTQRVNALRGVNSPSALNALKTHCPRGHPYDIQLFTQGRTVRSCRICLAWSPEKNEKMRAYRARKRKERA